MAGMVKSVPGTSNDNGYQLYFAGTASSYPVPGGYSPNNASNTIKFVTTSTMNGANGTGVIYRNCTFSWALFEW